MSNADISLKNKPFITWRLPHANRLLQQRTSPVVYNDTRGIRDYCGIDPIDGNNYFATEETHDKMTSILDRGYDNTHHNLPSEEDINSLCDSNNKLTFSNNDDTNEFEDYEFETNQSEKDNMIDDGEEYVNCEDDDNDDVEYNDNENNNDTDNDECNNNKTADNKVTDDEPNGWNNNNDNYQDNDDDYYNEDA